MVVITGVEGLQTVVWVDHGSCRSGHKFIFGVSDNSQPRVALIFKEHSLLPRHATALGNTVPGTLCCIMKRMRILKYCMPLAPC